MRLRYTHRALGAWLLTMILSSASSLVSAQEDSIEHEYVAPGGCFLGEELVHCALEQSHCHGMEFKSHRQLVLDDLEHAQQCQSSSNQRGRNHHVGMCASPIDQMTCTSHASNCAIGVKFVERVPYCDLNHNYFPERRSPLTWYGLCKPNGESVFGGSDAGTCLWSMDDCPNPQPNTWIPATANYATACTCDKVQTGACVHSATGRLTCAVGADACDQESSYLDWQQLRHMGKSCRLCEEFDTAATPPVHDRASRSQQRPHPSGPPEGCSTKAGLAGGGVGVAIGLVLATIGWGLGRSICRRKRRSKSTQEGEPQYPTEAIHEVGETSPKSIRSVPNETGFA